MAVRRHANDGEAPAAGCGASDAIDPIRLVRLCTYAGATNVLVAVTASSTGDVRLGVKAISMTHRWRGRLACTAKEDWGTKRPVTVSISTLNAMGGCRVWSIDSRAGLVFTDGFA